MIRRRLTVLVLTLIVTLLAIGAVSVFAVARHSVLAEVRRDVTNRVGALSGALQREPESITDAYVSRFGTSDVAAWVFDDEGQLLARSASLPDRELVFDPALFDGEEVVELDASGPLMVGGRRTVLSDGRTINIAIGRSPEGAYGALRTLGLVLLPVTLIVLTLTAGGVYLLIRRSLQPLERLGRDATAIARSADHQARISGSYRADEVGALADAVDSMLVSLGQAHGRAEEASANLRNFLADVSHELRAPLAIVTSSLDLLERDGSPDPAEARRMLFDVRGEVDRMARIVAQLLLIARTEDSTLGRDVPLLLTEVVQDAAARWARATLLPINTDLAGIDDIVVAGDQDQLRQIFDVLLDNAIRYTPPGGRIDLIGFAGPDSASVVVADTGVGIDPSDLPHVFERFHRGDDGGTGLGLAIARHLTESHGGQISATSNSGAGSRFEVTLPILSVSLPNEHAR